MHTHFRTKMEDWQWLSNAGRHSCSRRKWQHLSWAVFVCEAPLCWLGWLWEGRENWKPGGEVQRSAWALTVMFVNKWPTAYKGLKSQGCLLLCAFITSLQYIHHDLIVMKCLIINDRQNESVVDIFLEVQDLLCQLLSWFRRSISHSGLSWGC